MLPLLGVVELRLPLFRFFGMNVQKLHLFFLVLFLECIRDVFVSFNYFFLVFSGIAKTISSAWGPLGLVVGGGGVVD